MLFITNFYSHDTGKWRTSGHFVDNLGDAIAVQLKENPEVTKVKIYEDSIQQIGIYQDFFRQLNRQRDQAEMLEYRYKTYIVDKSKMYRIKGVKLSEETKIELI